MGWRGRRSRPSALLQGGGAVGGRDLPVGFCRSALGRDGLAGKAVAPECAPTGGGGAVGVEIAPTRAGGRRGRGGGGGSRRRRRGRSRIRGGRRWRGTARGGGTGPGPGPRTG